MATRIRPGCYGEQRSLIAQRMAWIEQEIELLPRDGDPSVTLADLHDAEYVQLQLRVIAEGMVRRRERRHGR